MGGDSRQVLDPLLNLNRYGCSPRPRLDTIALGSCTASSPTLNAWNAAEKQQQILQDDLRSTTDGDAIFAEHYERIRQRLRAVLDLDGGAADICFSPSATDGEFLALWLAIAGTPGPICNIVIAPDEVGSGTPLAASGCHFSDLAPWNAAGGIKGKPVAGFPLERIVLETVPVREPQGRLRSAAAIEGQITTLVERRIKAGYRVLLHVVEHTKTGIRAPRLELVRQLRERYGDGTLAIVVDAAQGRIDRRRIAIYLKLGCLVLLSGSKFFGGHPFSGALLVPPTDRFEPQPDWEFPVGLRDYLTAFEMPAHWQFSKTFLSRRKNVGLLLRWASALSEMETYYSHSPSLRQLILQNFRGSVEGIFADSPAIRLAIAPTPDWQHCSAANKLEFECGASVFSFSLPASAKGRPTEYLDIDTLRHIHSWLHQALSFPGRQGQFGWHACDILQHKFHLGQPVLLGKTYPQATDACVLRIAMGAALLNQLVLDTELGSNLPERLGWLDRQLGMLRQKLEAIVWLVQKQDRLRA